MRAERPPLSFELIDPAIHADTDACAMWTELRSQRPVAWVAPTAERPGFWVITKYDDIVSMSKSKHFSSARGNILGTLTTGGDPAAGHMLVATDAPRHPLVRRVLQVGFTSAKPQLEESLQMVACDLVRQAAEREFCEFVSEVAAQVPLITVCELLGVPKADQPHILEMSMAALAEEGVEATDSAESARQDVLTYFAQLVASRRRAPLESAEDLVSLMLNAEIEGAPISDTEVVLQCYNVLVGGNETGRLSAASGVLALIQNPTEWDKLKNDSKSLDDAVQEILRWTTPATYLGRIASQDVMVRDCLITAGDIVTLWMMSANRDEEIFDRSYTFDISRKPNRHLTFGRGPHACLGAQIARVGLKALLKALREEISEMELAGPPRRLSSTFLAGVSELPVRLAA